MQSDLERRRVVHYEVSSQLTYEDKIGKKNTLLERKRVFTLALQAVLCGWGTGIRTPIN